MFKLCNITSGTLDFFRQHWPGKAASRSAPFSGDDGKDGGSMECVYRQQLVHVLIREHELAASAGSIADWHLLIFLKSLQVYCCIVSAGNLVQKFTE